ncbi:hypothetical protein NBRGN_045_00550 [Nocardia brasiliensis NBRC 14402]|uniref:hypothetical protein n=1 Tax=Nocardia brasiliensis TaxID=37326 RepID=UPI0002F1799C|nr:hypothetical protein [Nocardia brasiliensis]GAJ81954.1 hypothetical protein NBRGN_045_00550 [Nocardia brasiliensis NBRC 14402]SUB55071.1 Uncharacterised protein [Nocardia brasiliensis]
MRREWGLLVAGEVRPLVKARNITDATMYACNLTARKRAKAIVVYRDSEALGWRRWIDDKPVPTQLAFDLPGKEAR